MARRLYIGALLLASIGAVAGFYILAADDDDSQPLIVSRRLFVVGICGKFCFVCKQQHCSCQLRLQIREDYEPILCVVARRRP